MRSGYHRLVALVDRVAAARPSEGPAVAIPGDELHVWETSLERPPSEVQTLHGLLAADERARAARFRFERDRSHYIVGRGVLRRLLERYTGVPAGDVEIVYGPNGKPMLRDGTLWFNVTHSGPVALYAFTTRAEVGVDVELDDVLRPGFARERIAERFFSPDEVRTLRSLPEPLQARAFLTCWTRKEAFIKARGDGLSLPLDSFDVTLGDGSPAALLRTAWSEDEPGHWQLKDLSEPERGYIAALAIRSEGCRVIKHRVTQSFEDHREIYEEEL
jgi:4'-phosphopantetheinyl transferase